METSNHGTKQKKKSSRTKLHKTKFVRVKKDQQLKDQYGAIFVSVYYALKNFSKNDSGVTATELYGHLNKQILRKDIIEILHTASWSKALGSGRFCFFDKEMEDRRRQEMDTRRKALEKEFYSWLSNSYPLSKVDEIRNAFPAIGSMLVQKKVLSVPISETTKIGQVETALRNAKKVFANKKIRNNAVLVLTTDVEFLRDRKGHEATSPEINVPDAWIRYDCTNSQQFANTKPVSCHVGPLEINEKNWARVLVAIAEHEIANNNPALKPLYKQSLLAQRDGKPFFLTSKIEGLHCAVLSNGYWVNINYSIPRLLDHIKELCFSCGYTKKDIVLYGEKKSASSNSSNVQPKKNEAGEKFLYQKEVTQLLQAHYSYGYRIESSIEMKRFRKYAAAANSSIPENDDQLKAEILHAGILIDDKVYVISDTTLSGLNNILEILFADNINTVFFESFADIYRDFMEDNHITSHDMLRDIIAKNQERLFANSSDIYLGKNFISAAGKLTENEAVANELCRVWEDSPVMSVNQLSERLRFIPKDIIMRYLSGNRRFVWVSEEMYLLIDRFVISNAEEAVVHDFVAQQCSSQGFASISDVPLGNMAENNYELSTTGLYSAIYNKVLFNDFYLNGKILTKDKSGLDVVTLVKQYLVTKETCTFEEANTKVTELAGGKYRYMAYEALYNSMTRVDRDNYVADRYVQFDIDAIDNVLSAFVVDGFIAIKEVTTFALFPVCGFPWNHYLLESFCYKYSRKYSLRVIGFNDRNAGIIAEQTVTSNYGELLARAAARANIDLNPEAIGKFFFDTGFMAKSKFAWLEDITQQSKAIREDY